MIKSGKKASIKKQVVEDKAREPDFMVQVDDPATLRRDLLESLREIIIFMQGYEKFRKIQEEKVATFTALKNDVRELNSIVEGRLRRYVPKGKLRGITPAQKHEEEQAEAREVQVVNVRTAPQRIPLVEPTPAATVVKKVPNELEELETQLKEIEQQLQDIK